MKKFLSIVFALCLLGSFIPEALAATPQHEDEYLWNQTTIDCYVDTYITDTYGSIIYNAISGGLQAWNATDAPNVNVSSDYYYSWDVFVMMFDYGETGWDGNCTATYDTNTLTTQYARIRLNTGGIPDTYDTDSTLWKALACHEMGHAHGLGHNTVTTEQSIMKEDTEDYYKYSGTAPRLTSPQFVDRSAVNALY